MDFEKGPATVEQQVEAIKLYAQAKYEQGWDIVVETMSDREIKDEIKGCTTRWGAIERLHKKIKPLIEYRREIQGA